MTRGISEQDVFEAADKLLARGERPTIERVRLELGRGSPNTVNRLLDGWWAGLASRVATKDSAKLPPQFQAACERMYEKVVLDSRTKAEQDLAGLLAEVDMRKQSLAAKELELSSQESVLSVPMEMLRADLAKANQQVVDLATQNGLHLRDIDQLTKSEQKLRKQLVLAQDCLSTLQEKSKVELARVRGRWEAQENRWLRQIDALREDLKLLRAEKASEKRLASQKVSTLEESLRKLQKALAVALKGRTLRPSKGPQRTQSKSKRRLPN
ncbi:MAG: DNA-binding protein [Pseudomonadota bacterium]